MNKKKIRCYEVYVQVANNIYNYPVYLVVYEGWSHFSLATCNNCGELFVIDWENPATKGLSIIDISSTINCPKCKISLKETIRDYPKTIKLPNGLMGSYIPDTMITPDTESFIMEFYELTP